MHRFYLPPSDCGGSEIALQGREAHHALDVLRMRPGDRLTVLDGQGCRLLCEVAQTSRRELRARVLEEQRLPRPACAVTLCQAVPKGKLMETIAQKATELGASRIVPLLTERVVSHLDGESAAAKAQKWRLAAIEAVKQCGSPWLPEVGPPLPLGTVLARGETHELPLVASLYPEARHPREVFDEFRAQQGRAPRSACIWIGPEGDFTAEELAAIQASGAKPVSLGPRVLRTDTATICCLAVINHEVGIGTSA